MTKSAPGPADLYPLPPTVGFESHDLRKQRMPQFSFGSRAQVNDNSVGPGPARYNVDKLVRYGVSKGHVYSMGPKTYYREKSKSPGPLAYQLRDSPIYKGFNSPAYSMGKMNTFFYKNFAPAPNAYGINDSLTRQRAPQYSLGVKKYLSELERSPGPARYAGGNLSYTKPTNPSYSFAPRTNYVFKLYGPGPNYYNRMDYRPGRQAPKYSFGVQHSSRSGVMIVPSDNTCM